MNKFNSRNFSHDLSVQQKTAKRNLYVDSRDLKDGALAEAETNENWDENQLNEVAEKKHGEKDRKRPNQTDIVSQFLLITKLLFFRFASTLSKLLKTTSTDGSGRFYYRCQNYHNFVSGNVQMEKNAFIATLFHQVN